jgi:GGDEF domain-containing protein
VALAMEASSQGQEVILRRIQKALKKANAGESRFQLSVSIGVARFDPKHPVSLGELMLQADKSMYEEKRKRRKLLRRVRQKTRAANVRKKNTRRGPGQMGLEGRIEKRVGMEIPVRLLASAQVSSKKLLP